MEFYRVHVFDQTIIESLIETIIETIIEGLIETIIETILQKNNSLFVQRYNYVAQKSFSKEVANCDT